MFNAVHVQKQQHQIGAAVFILDCESENRMSFLVHKGMRNESALHGVDFIVTLLRPEVRNPGGIGSPANDVVDEETVMQLNDTTVLIGEGAFNNISVQRHIGHITLNIGL